MEVWILEELRELGELRGNTTQTLCVITRELTELFLRLHCSKLSCLLPYFHGARHQVRLSAYCRERESHLHPLTAEATKVQVLSLVPIQPSPVFAIGQWHCPLKASVTCHDCLATVWVLSSLNEGPGREAEITQAISVSQN